MFPPVIKDVLEALKEVESIERPACDDDSAALNSKVVYSCLSPENKDKVDHVEGLLKEYLRNPEGDPNKLSVTTLNKHDYRTNFNPDQYDQSRYVGSVSGIGESEWDIDISDDSTE